MFLPAVQPSLPLGVCAAENGATIVGQPRTRGADVDDVPPRRTGSDAAVARGHAEWLPEGHLAHHVSNLVDGLDLTSFYASYEGDGRRNAPYEPRMMVKVMLYAYATGCFRRGGRAEAGSGRGVPGAGGGATSPHHRTLCEFRRRHVADFRALFVAVVRLAGELGVARFGKLSIDGTK